MQQDDEQDLERALEEHARRIFNASNEQERKKAERELTEHIARPGLTDNLEELVRDFEIRLKRSATVRPNMPAEYREAFEPFLKRVAAIPPFEKWEVPAWDLWTQHMVKFSFAYGADPLFALLGLKAFALIAPSAEYFEAVTAAPDDIERARKMRAFVEAVEADVFRIVEVAAGRFVEALRGRLGVVLDETLGEIAVWALNELGAELKTTGEKHVAQVRDHILKEYTKVEKVRLGTPAPGAPTLTKEVFEAIIDKAQADLKPHKMDQTKSAVVTYIKNNYPAVRCSDRKQLNRMLEKYGLEHKFTEEAGGQNSK